MQTTVYKVSGPNTEVSYYGYLSADRDILPTFIKIAQGRAAEDERGDTRFLSENGNDTTKLSVKALKTFEEEFDALVYRNEQRSIDPTSVTGPSVWPYAERASKEHPDKVITWKLNNTLRKAKNAREAYQAGAWSYESIAALSATHGRDTIVSDLNQLTYTQFALKYINRAE